MRNIIFTLLIAGALSLYSWPQNDLGRDARSELLALENVRNQADEKRDIRTLSLIFDESMIYIDVYGSLLTKTQFLAQAKGAGGHFHPVVSQATVIRVYGDTALVVGSYYLKGAHGDKGYQREGKFIDTWVLKQGKWVCVVTQGTPVPR